MADIDPKGVQRVRARNASPMTLDGTNTYVAAGWVVDPGPDDPEHREAVMAAADGVVEGVALTHSHADHSEGAAALAERAGGVPVVLPREDGEIVGPFTALATPGHSADHMCLLFDRVAFAGDLVMGWGSVIVPPGEGGLSGYLDSLRRLRALGLDVLCPGHGPYVDDPTTKIDEYLEHRAERERMLVAALDAGARSEDELLDGAWAEVPAQLRGGAGVALRAGLEKLAEEDRLPAGVDPALLG